MSRRRVLLVAFHFPPLLGSSGWLRTAAFARHLPEHGWSPVVLSASPRAYSATDAGSLATVEGVDTCRAFALDTSRHLSIRGRYPLLLALPDRWVSWFPAGVRAGLRMIRRTRPSVIWATFPVPTAIAIGLALRRLSGLPLIVDLRDAMVDPDYPETASERWAYRWLERHAVNAAAAIVLTTPGAAKLYRQRYPDIPASRFHIIPNGYDEEAFRRVEQRVAQQASDTDARIRLLHSGLLSRIDRNPQAFFEALKSVLESDAIQRNQLQVILRGSGDETYYQQQIDSLGIADVVQLVPSVDYETALGEMLGADGLLLFQGATCNHA
ncbi:MAG TPA: glycosyltransferase, partial [Chromatiales bacterium]|nr:glycosyltransferase [Chromatiales bacterium]